MDRELAERVAAATPDLHGDDQAPEPPSPAGYRLTEYLLLTLIDSVRGVQAAVIAAAGVPPPDMTPMPRPVTAIEVVREEIRVRQLHAMVDIFAPHQREKGWETTE